MTINFISKYSWIRWMSLLVIMMLLAGTALADFPTVEKMGQFTAKEKGDWLGVFELYAFRGITILIFAASAIGFLWAAYAAIAKFNLCRVGKAEWSELVVLVIVVAGLMVFNTLLLTTSGEIVGLKKTTDSAVEQNQPKLDQKIPLDKLPQKK